MKAKDLMIGDYVTFKDCQNDNAPTIVKIEGLGYQGRGVVEEALVAIDGDAAFDLVEINEEFVGIPLTPEILEKNGWKLISKTQYKLEYSWSTGAIAEYADIHIYVGKDHGNVWRWDFPILNIHLYRGDIELTKFRYVHELQHALKLCGIEKEVVL
jgi:hypothetical protein